MDRVVKEFTIRSTRIQNYIQNHTYFCIQNNNSQRQIRTCYGQQKLLCLGYSLYLLKKLDSKLTYPLAMVVQVLLVTLLEDAS